MKKTNPKLIGVFVLGGLVLVVAALVLFSSQDFFTPKRQFVAYFHQSVNGLNVGAPVRFRGIPVGEVLAIEGVYEPDNGNMIPRLVLEFRPETLENAAVEEDEYTLFPLLLKHGLRASLKSASLLTGQLYVSLDFHPDVPIRTLGKGNDEFPEMPTIDSGFDEALAKLSELPIEEVLRRAAGAFDAAEKLLRDPNIDHALISLTKLLDDSDAAVIDLGAFVRTDVARTLREANRALATTRSSLTTMTELLAKNSLPQIDLTMHELEQSLKLVQQRLSREDPLNHELLAALREIAAAARSTGALADYLEEHPEALLKGKTAP